MVLSNVYGELIVVLTLAVCLAEVMDTPVPLLSLQVSKPIKSLQINRLITNTGSEKSEFTLGWRATHRSLESNVALSDLGLLYRYFIQSGESTRVIHVPMGQP